MTNLTRRTVLSAGAAALAMAGFATAGRAQDKIRLRFSAVFSEQDIRAEMMKKFVEGIGDDFEYQGYLGGTLFKQGTELVALQRGNLEMSNIAPQDFAKQMPEWSIVTAAYVFRDTDHLKAFFASEEGEALKQRTQDELDVRVLGPTYFGVRQVGLKPDKKIETPADMEGIKLRMPGGDAWQFLGESLGANPTPMAYSEVYTGLQTGAIDGQDNPLPNVENMKFYEVMSQIVLTAHLVGFDLLTISNKTWNGLSPEQQETVQKAADEAIAFSTQAHLDREEELVAFLKDKGLDIYEPDIDAFREHAQEMYLASDLAKSWPEGLLDKINAM